MVELVRLVSSLVSEVVSGVVRHLRIPRQPAGEVWPCWVVVCAYRGWLPRLPHRACLSRVEAPGSRVANDISEADAVGGLEAGGAREHNAGHQSAGPRGRRSRTYRLENWSIHVFGNSVGRHHSQSPRALPADSCSGCGRPSRVRLSSCPHFSVIENQPSRICGYGASRAAVGRRAALAKPAPVCAVAWRTAAARKRRRP